MARVTHSIPGYEGVTHVRKAQQRYKTVKVLDDQGSPLDILRDAADEFLRDCPV